MRLRSNYEKNYNIFFIYISKINIFRNWNKNIWANKISIYFNKKNKNEVIGIGILEISTDNLKDDKKKKIKFYFPKKGLLTNRKKWIEIKKYYLETKNNEFEILKKIEHVKVFAILERNEISKYDEVETIEGEYVGYIPIIISQYGKLKNIKEE